MSTYIAIKGSMPIIQYEQKIIVVHERDEYFGLALTAFVSRWDNPLSGFTDVNTHILKP